MNVTEQYGQGYFGFFRKIYRIDSSTSYRDRAHLTRLPNFRPAFDVERIFKLLVFFDVKNDLYRFWTRHLSV